MNNHLLVPVKTRLVVAKQKVWTHSFEPKKLSDHCSSYFIAVANPPDDDEDIYANAEVDSSIAYITIPHSSI